MNESFNKWRFQLLRPAELAALLLLFAAALLFMHISAFEPFLADSVFLNYPTNASPALIPVVHFSTNAFFAWRVDPLIHQLSFGGGFEVYVLLQLFILMLGALCCLRRLADDDVLDVTDGILALLLGAAILLLFGIDAAILGALTWCPWLLFVLLRWTEDTPPRLASRVALGLMTILLTVSLQMLALPVVIVCLLLIAPAAVHQPRRELLFVSSVLFVASIFAAFAFVAPTFPDYPNNAHVVPGYGTPFGFQPDLGAMPPLQLLDRTWLRDAYLPQALVVIFVSMCLFLAHVRAQKPVYQLLRNAAMLALVLATFVLLDSRLFSIGFAQSAPMQSLTRILPGFFYLALSPLCLAFSIVLMFFAMVASHFNHSRKVAALVLAVLIVAPRSRHDDLHFPRFVAAESKQLLKSLFRDNKLQQKELATVINSPSFQLIRDNGLEVLKHVPQKDLKFIDADDVDAKYSGLVKVDDKDASHRRFTTRQGFQAGKEWLHVYLKEPMPVSAVKILTGRYYTDFPRGLRVSIKERCSGGEEEFGDYKVVHDEPRHEGEILFTDLGFPYYSEQYSAAAYFPDEAPVQCILLQQIGKEPHFDWTVTDIQLALKKP